MTMHEGGAGVRCSCCDGRGSVLAGADVLLAQCERVLDAVDESAYTEASVLMAGGTVGKHLRHTLDHYAAIVTGALGAEPIDYDHRIRGVPVETDRGAARAQIAAIRKGIAGLRGALSEPVLIRVMLDDDGREAVLGSTLAREVAFATHHGIHHVAIMRAIAAEAGVPLAHDVGKAPSTVHFERSAARA